MCVCMRRGRAFKAKALSQVLTYQAILPSMVSTPPHADTHPLHVAPLRVAIITVML